MADHLVNRWAFGRFQRRGRIAESRGRISGLDIRVLKPLTFMNRSGQALREFRELPGWEPARDLMVLVDDVALEPGRFRIRGSGSAGGHNGLLSIEGALRSQEYARFRIGVGAPADRDVDRADWVLSAPRPDQEEEILAGFDRMSEAVECWLSDGVETAMNRFNRS